MDWTDLLVEPRQVTGLYGAAPDLDAFRLDRIELYGQTATLWGDFAELPAVLPDRWRGSGRTRVAARFDLSGVRTAEVRGTPRLRFNGVAGYEGQPVDLAISVAGSVWKDQNGTERPHILVTGEAEFVSFRFVSEDVNVQARGEEPQVA